MLAEDRDLPVAAAISDAKEDLLLFGAGDWLALTDCGGVEI